MITRRDLLKMSALTPVAMALAPLLPAGKMSDCTLAREGAKRLHAEIIRRGAKIDPNKPTTFVTYIRRGGKLVAVVGRDTPPHESSTHSCDDSRIFDLDRNVADLADKLVGRVSAPSTRIRFYPQPLQPGVANPERYSHGWCGDVFLTAHRFIAVETGNEVTVLEVWAG